MLDNKNEKTIAIILSVIIIIPIIAVVVLSDSEAPEEEMTGYKIEFIPMEEVREQHSLSFDELESNVEIESEYSQIIFMKWELKWTDDNAIFPDEFSMECEVENDLGDHFAKEVSGNSEPLLIECSDVFLEIPPENITLNASSEEDVWDYINSTYPSTTANYTETCNLTFQGDDAFLDWSNEATLIVTYVPYEVKIEKIEPAETEITPPR